MKSLTFGLYTQVSDSESRGPLVLYHIKILGILTEKPISKY